MLRAVTAASTVGRRSCQHHHHLQRFQHGTLSPSTSLVVDGRCSHNRWFSSSEKDGNNNNKNGKKTNTNALIVPSKVGLYSGDEAPRMPHVLALPVINRPLFPGVVTSVTLTEPATIDALENLFKDHGPSGTSSSRQVEMAVVVHRMVLIFQYSYAKSMPRVFRRVVFCYQHPK